MLLSELQPSCVASLQPQLSLLLGTTQTAHAYIQTDLKWQAKVTLRSTKGTKTNQFHISS